MAVARAAYLWLCRLLRQFMDSNTSMLDALLEMAKPQRRIDEDIPDKPRFSLLLKWATRRSKDGVLASPALGDGAAK